MSLIKQIIKGENNCVKLIKVQQYTRGPIHSAIAATRFAKFNRSVHDKFEWGADKCVFKELKNGEFRFYTERYYYTPLEFCDKCGAILKPSYKNHRWFPSNTLVDKKEKTLLANNEPSLFFYKWKVLCTPCWSQIRPIAKQAQLYYEMKYYINKINREIANESKKNSNHRQP